jgi:hypothetical protein
MWRSRGAGQRPDRRQYLTIRAIFSGPRFGLDPYQREYAWTEKQVEDLINDLTGRFAKEWSPKHELKDVANYRPYFLGPVITSSRDGISFLIDGQQRLTTVMLLLIWLRRLQEGRDDAIDGIDQLIYSNRFGERTFAVDDKERRRCLHALLTGADFDTASEPSASVRNLWYRFADIDRLFPEELRDEELPFFICWLLERVQLSTRRIPANWLVPWGRSQGGDHHRRANPDRVGRGLRSRLSGRDRCPGEAVVERLDVLATRHGRWDAGHARRCA